MPDGQSPQAGRFALLHRLAGVGAVVVLLGAVALLRACGFLTLVADEMAKAKTAWQTLHYPEAWLNCIWLPGHLALIDVAYLCTGDLWLASRLVAPGFGVLAVAGVYRLGAPWPGRWAGAIGAILAATQPLVIWLSASGLSDMLYAGPFVLGVALYLDAHRTGRRLPLYAGVGLLAFACLSHYNAWALVALFALTILALAVRDASPGRRHHAAALAVLAVGPLAWCAIIWAWWGHPLAFLGEHAGWSAEMWTRAGYEATWANALKTLGAEAYVHIGLLAVPGLASIVYLTQREGRAALAQLWLLLAAFTVVVLVLYATGGRPTAFSPRYLLVPALLLAALGARPLAQLAASPRAAVRYVSVALLLVVVAANLRQASRFPDTERPIREARVVAKALEPLLDAHPDARVLLEVKFWNHGALCVFTGSPDAVKPDRALDPLVDRPSLFLRPWETFQPWAAKRAIRYLCVHSQPTRDHISRWPIQPVASAESYTIFELPAGAK